MAAITGLFVQELLKGIRVPDLMGRDVESYPLSA